MRPPAAPSPAPSPSQKDMAKRMARSTCGCARARICAGVQKKSKHVGSCGGGGLMSWRLLSRYVRVSVTHASASRSGTTPRTTPTPNRRSDAPKPATRLRVADAPEVDRRDHRRPRRRDAVHLRGQRLQQPHPRRPQRLLAPAHQPALDPGESRRQRHRLLPVEAQHGWFHGGPRAVSQLGQAAVVPVAAAAAVAAGAAAAAGDFLAGTAAALEPGRAAAAAAVNGAAAAAGACCCCSCCWRASSAESAVAQRLGI